MICMLILFFDMVAQSFGYPFLQEPILLAMAGVLEMGLLLALLAIYQVATGKDIF